MSRHSGKPERLIDLFVRYSRSISRLSNPPRNRQHLIPIVSLLVNRLRAIQALWETLPLDPAYLVSYLKPCVLYCNGQPVDRPSSRERYQVPAGLQNSKTLPGPVLTGYGHVPTLSHKSDSIRWIANYGVNAVFFHSPHYLDAFAEVQINRH
tara:strand:- start:2870 stop:3325 length:456 start_codon:yes stop_codon:yes gene_type:complete